MTCSRTWNSTSAFSIPRIRPRRPTPFGSSDRYRRSERFGSGFGARSALGASPSSTSRPAVASSEADRPMAWPTGASASADSSGHTRGAPRPPTPRGNGQPQGALSPTPPSHAPAHLSASPGPGQQGGGDHPRRHVSETPTMTISARTLRSSGRLRGASRGNGPDRSAGAVRTGPSLRDPLARLARSPPYSPRDRARSGGAPAER